MTTRQRGQPLIFLAMIVVLWIGVRVFAWTRPTPEPPHTVFAEAAPHAPRPLGGPADVLANRPLATAGFERPILAVAGHPMPHRPVLLMIAVKPPVTAAGPGLAEGHAEVGLTMAGEMPISQAFPVVARLAQSQAVAAPPPSSQPPRAQERRWSGDAWALVRGGSGPGGAGPGVPTYGGNQVGAVLRYRLVHGSSHRPAAYFRVSAALNDFGEREAALGLSVRPVAAIPVIVAAEGRVGALSGRTLARPAVMAVTELPPVALPGRTRAEFYAQAGYVGGAGATAFADGQLRVDRRVAQAGPLELRAGAGAWGGAQRGAARLDVGPGATIGIAKGPAAVRVGFDWRFRVAGDAKPASGPALTVSAGF